MFFSVGDDRLNQEEDNETYYEVADVDDDQLEKEFKSFSEQSSDQKCFSGEHFVKSKNFEQSPTCADFQSPLEHYKRSSLFGSDENYREKGGVKIRGNGCFSQCFGKKPAKFQPELNKNNSTCTLI